MKTNLSSSTLLALIQKGPQPVARRDIANALHVKGDGRVHLKVLLKEMVERGELLKKGKSYSTPTSDLYCEAIVTELSADGEVIGEQVTGQVDKPLRLRLVDAEGRAPALAIGERALIRYQPTKDDELLAGIIIKKLERNIKKIIGVFQAVGEAGTLLPTDRRQKGEFFISPLHTLKARDGDLVEVELLKTHGRGRADAKVVEVLGRLEELHSPTFIAIHDRELPTEFPPEALSQAENAAIPTLQGRKDLRDIPLVTIDDEDARDFDDAVWARPDPNPDNAGGWQLMVAIADVSHYVKPHDALDQEAFLRGNSVYFPDQVIPMLPEALSNGLCSLRPDEDRACLAVEMVIDHRGKLLNHRFVRGLMRSVARLTYNNVQQAYDDSKGSKQPVREPKGGDKKHPDRVKDERFSKEFVDEVIMPLYGAFNSLKKNREFRGTLELDIPEQRIYLGKDGKVTHIAPRTRHDSHKLIEEFMILANVAAAITLSDGNIATLYRVHDEPNEEKVNALAEFLRGLGLNFAKGQVVRPKVFNTLLKQASATPHAHAVHDLVLRSQAQAVYSPENIGHFGLSLARYCHFTSPIRRYADLIVHRALVHALQMEEEAGYPYSLERLQKVGEHISMTERRAASAERETVERYVAGYLAQRMGDVFECRISGLSDAGLFLNVLESGADGLLPMRSLPNDFYDFDRKNHRLVGRRRRQAFQLGEHVTARLEEANALTGGLIFLLVEDKAAKPGKVREKSDKPKKMSVSRKRKAK